jgi:molybdate-binding protein/DNA-binding XRE family transcriptional regulator
MKTEGVQNRLKAVWLRVGLSQQQLATAAAVTRQTVGGIEAGLYAPTMAVALRLARALGCRVEELFWLEDDLPVIEAEIMGASPPMVEGESVRVGVARVGERWVARPLVGDAAFRREMVPADGLAEPTGQGRVRVRLLDEVADVARTVALAGCTPALSLWARSAERWFPGLRVQWTHANSTEALEALTRGTVHAAGLHIHDAATGVDNTEFVRRRLAGRVAVTPVHLGVWEEGFAVAPGNPKAIQGAGDLARADVQLVNREPGAGCRLLLDSALVAADVPVSFVRGYERIVGEHTRVAQVVAVGEADTGVTTSGVAALYGLSFVPLHRVRYDLAVRTDSLVQEPVRQLLETLEQRWVRSQLRVSGGYDTERTGEIVAEISGDGTVNPQSRPE